MTTSEDTVHTIRQFRGSWQYLSMFHQSLVTLYGIDYPSGEHAFHAQKTTNITLRRNIAAARTPAEAKQLGRSVPLIDGWDEWRRYDAMWRVVIAKFYPGRDLTKQLICTDGAVLIEGNTWHDNTWGVCSCGRCKGGHNLLGWMLMRHRSQITDSATPARGVTEPAQWRAMTRSSAHPGQSPLILATPLLRP